jgi:hypothetical protein
MHACSSRRFPVMFADPGNECRYREVAAVHRAPTVTEN